MYFLYNILLAIVLIVSLPYWLMKLLFQGKYRAGLSERLGRMPERLRRTGPTENCIWIHAVSVGEILAISKLVEGLRERFPAWRIAVSSTTLSGQTLARTRFGPENVFYFPLDFGLAIKPYLILLRPKLVVIAETEFWPNFLRLAKASGARIAVVNARISDRSFPGYRRFRPLLTNTLANIDMFLAQTEVDHKRLVEIGAPTGRVQISGNLKFDVTVPAESSLVAKMQAAIPKGTQVVVCGSTVEGEEELLLDAWKNISREYKTAVMVLAPRRPERFNDVAELLRTRGISFYRRTGWSGDQLTGGVFLLDSIGELASIYSLANIAFVGGSLVPRGGHNILEPAQFGKPIVVGFFTDNFRDIVSEFQKANAVRVLEKGVQPEGIAQILLSLLSSPDQQRALGARALAVFSAHPGATERTVKAIEVLLWVPSTVQKRYDPVKQ